MIAGSQVQREEACVVEATSLPAAWQVRFQAGDNEGRADTVKDGTGGSAGLRPHELLEAALATCMTISARMALADLGVPDGKVRVRVHLERERSATRFRYELVLDPALEPHRPAVTERVERSPVRSTLSQPLIFEPAATQI
jgi:putative redox protein